MKMFVVMVVIQVLYGLSGALGYIWVINESWHALIGGALLAFLASILGHMYLKSRE